MTIGWAAGSVVEGLNPSPGEGCPCFKGPFAASCSRMNFGGFLLKKHPTVQCLVIGQLRHES